MSDRVATLCDQCGQTDDHPKIHLGDVTKHHDCLSYTEEEAVKATSDTVGTIIDAAKSGTHGDKLLRKIDSLHQEG